MKLRLFLALILALALIVTAGMMASAAPPGFARAKSSKVQTETPTPPSVEQIRESLAGNGKAWGRIAKELDTEKTPGSIATLVHILKAAAPQEPAEEPAIIIEDNLPEFTDSISVSIVELLMDDDDNLTGYVVIQLSDDENENPVLYTIQLDEELLHQVDSGFKLVLSVDEEGNVIIALADDDLDDTQGSEDSEDEEGDDEEAD